MRYFLTLILFLSLSITAPAQQVSNKAMKAHLKNVEKSKEKGTIIWDLDTVFKAGVPYCIVCEVPFGASQHSDYSVKSLQGKELIYVKYACYTRSSDAPGYSITNPAINNVSYYTYCFTDTKNKAEISYSYKVYKTVAEDDLVDGDHINSDEEDKFLSINGMKFSQEASKEESPESETNTNNTYNNMVQRNRAGSISFKLVSVGIESEDGFSQVIQDNKVIGNLHASQYTANGIIIKIFAFSMPDGTKVAQAQCNSINSHEWTIVTFKNNLSHHIFSTENNDAMDLAKYLINAYYL
jgi:hypothetical protein